MKLRSKPDHQARRIRREPPLPHPSWRPGAIEQDDGEPPRRRIDAGEFWAKLGL